MDTGKYVVDKALIEKPKKRKNQDPNRPRRAMSSFLYYARVLLCVISRDECDLFPVTSMGDDLRMMGRS